MKNYQKIIFINYGWVENEAIDQVINAPIGTTEKEAEKMGLTVLPYNPAWKEKAFVTIIRNNWDLLPNNEIAVLIGKTEDELKEILRDYDFLDIKLGDKHEILPYKYEDGAETQEIKEFVSKYAKKPERMPFDFFDDDIVPVKINNKKGIKDRFVASYNANYSGALDDDNLPDYSAEYLEKLQKIGTTGIWLHETLRRISDFPYDRSLSKGYEKRINNLRKLTERCAKYGIGVYLYLNEPRSMEASFFKTHENIRGQDANDGTFIMCTSTKEVQDYLYTAVKSVADNCPLLSGIMTITMSENPTNCYCKPWNQKYRQTDCPRCKNRLPEEVCAEVNNIMAKALSDGGNGHTKLIANLWGWSEFMGWNEEQTLSGITLLDKNVEVLSVSEYGKNFVRGGVKSQVIDYSISEVGPSEITRKSLKLAKELGHNTWAKIQVNNSWECSAVPYVPCFDLMLEHINNLKDLGVSGLMMGWSLGGYPGGALPLCNLVCSGETEELENWYAETFGNCANLIKESSKIFSESFREFPFSVDSLYFGGQTLGPGNEVTITPQNKKSTMVCFAFDDYESYTKPYGIDIYLSQYEKLISKWKDGLKVLSNVTGNTRFETYKRVSESALILFESAYLIAKVAKFKRTDDGLPVVKESIKRLNEITLSLINIMSKDATIGFEMTNHYFFNQNLLLYRLYERNNLLK